MSIFSMVFASMHLSHALNRGVHHLGRSATFWAVSSPSQAPTCALSASLTFMGSLAAAIARRPARFSAIIAHWRVVPAGRRAQHAARPSTWQSPALAVVGSATGTSWRPCASLIASRTPPASKSRATAKIFRWRRGMHAEIASFRSLTGGKRRIGTALPQRGVCAMFGEAGSVHDGVCGSDRSAADLAACQALAKMAKSEIK